MRNQARREREDKTGAMDPSKTGLEGDLEKEGQGLTTPA